MLKKGISLGFIQMISVLYIVVWTISPFMEIDTIYRLLGVAFAGLWCVILVFRQKPLKINYEQFFAACFLVMVVTVTYIDTGKVSGIIKQISYFMLVICFIISHYYKDHWKELSVIIPVVLILLIFFNIRTAGALIEDPTIARRLVRDDESIYVYLRQGIGGYSLIYPQVCVFPALLQWTISAFRKNKLFFVLGTVCIVSYLAVIFNAGYSIAIFATGVGTLLLLFYRGKSGLKAFLVAFFVFAGLMLALLYIEDFRNWILDTFQNNAIHKKINDLIATSESGAAEGSIHVRMVRYLGSVKVIFKYPVIGALWRDGGGGHSAVLDTLARYGLFGVVVYCYMIYYVPNYYKAKFGNGNALVRRAANATLVSLLIVSFLDSFTYAFMGMILIVLPLLYEDIIKWTDNKNEDTVDSKLNTGRSGV